MTDMKSDGDKVGNALEIWSDCDTDIEQYFNEVPNPIRRILIANNGNAAVKGIRSMKAWSLEKFNKNVFSFVVLSTPDDLDAKSEYIFEGDSVVPVPSGASSANFGNITLIVKIAIDQKCDAVWPGWGHASENYRLPEALAKEGITWIGPSPTAMLALGDKIGSTIMAQSVEVPTLPWSGSSVSCRLNSDTGQREVNEELLLKACVKDDRHAIELANSIGYPLMMKAAEGGGGKGIRRIYGPEEVASAYHAVTSEVRGSAVFLMGLLDDCRHLEVQVIADGYGNAWAIGSRDCSLQRRCQKMIEEGPITAAPRELVIEMEKSAERLIASVSYENAATVEFLYNPKLKKYYFLEVNARLQVEHVVTEENTDTNLPAAQLQVAMGKYLTEIEDISLWYNRPDQSVVTLRHCIACRVTAERVDNNFQPSCGKIFEITFRPGRNFWGYFSIGGHGAIHQYADSQFGHIFSTGKTRTEAVKNAILAIGRLTIRGEIHTNVAALIQLLHHSDFKYMNTSTTWIENIFSYQCVPIPQTVPCIELENIIVDKALNPSIDDENFTMFFEGLITAVVYRASKKFEKSVEEFRNAIETGHEPTGLRLTCIEDLVYKTEEGDLNISVKAEALSSTRIRVTLNDTVSFVECEYTHLDGDGTILLCINGKSYKMLCHDERGIRVKFTDHTTMTFYDDVDPSLILSDMSGRILRFTIPDGERGDVGDELCEIESMKMFINVYLKKGGIVHHVMSAGSTFRDGETIARLTLDDYKEVRSVSYEGGFPKGLCSLPFEEMVNHERIGLLPAFELADKVISELLEGYHPSLSESKSTRLETVVDRYMSILCDLRLLNLRALNHLKQASRLLPEDVVNGVFDYLTDFVEGETLPDDSLTEKLHTLKGKGKEVERLFHDLLHLDDGRVFRCNVIAKKVKTFLKHQLDYKAVDRSNTESIVETYRVHSTTKRGAEILMHMIRRMAREYGSQDFGWVSSEMIDLMAEIEDELNNKDCTELVLACRCLRLSRPLPRLMERISSVKAAFISGLDDGQEESKPTTSAHTHSNNHPNSDWIVNAAKIPDDALVAVLTDIDCAMWIRKFAFSLYVRRHYESLGLNRMKDLEPDKTNTDPSRLVSVWTHSSPLEAQKWKLSHNPSGNLSDHENPRGNHRLRHLLKSFHETADYDAIDLENNYGTYHLSIGCSFRNPRDFQENAENVLECIRAVVGDVDDGGAITDRVSLVCIIGLEGSDDAYQRGDVPQKNSSFPEDFPLTADWLRVVLRTCRPSMAAMKVQAVKIVYLSGYSTARNLGFFHWQPVSLNSRLRIVYFTAHGDERYGDEDTSLRLRYREVECFRFCPLPYIPLLELARLSLFDVTPVPILQPSIFIFKAVPKQMGTNQMKGPVKPRYFCRTIFQCHFSDVDEASYFQAENTWNGAYCMKWAQELERSMLASMQTLESVIPGDGSSRPQRYEGGNHLTIVMLTYGGKPDSSISARNISEIATKLFQNNVVKIHDLNIHKIEIRVLQRGRRQVTLSVPMRVVTDTPTGQAVRCRVYAERVDPSTGAHLFHPIQKRSLNAAFDGGDEYAQKPVNTPHPVFTELDSKRFQAQQKGTIYAKDFMQLFESACAQLWREYITVVESGNSPRRFLSKKSFGCSTPSANTKATDAFEFSFVAATGIPDKLIEATELVLDTDNQMQLSSAVDENQIQKIGVLAWDVCIRTPEFPQSRRFILIANDITHESGSFGVKEDLLFMRATERAMQDGIPRIFIAANSGARIGLATEIQQCYKVEWMDPDDPRKGIKYLYLTPDDFAIHHEHVVCHHYEHPTEGTIYVIDSIIGEKIGLGVENLAGSGAIAGITSRAYNEVVTFTYVTGMTVGIGAYLTRLGTRVIQKKENAPILLTGYNALNKLIGKDVYRSNDEIGGPGVMFQNGISYDIVDSDRDGCVMLLRLLSFVPAVRKCGLIAIVKPPTVSGASDSNDQLNRKIQYSPDPVDDPRFMLCGKYLKHPCDRTYGEKKGEWLSGLFDRHSWLETMGNWAKSVITGRARLGGMPIGVVAVETRITEAFVSADPAMPETKELKLQRAGQVWFPESAYKTAQAIKDFNREELPLIILANWRGFSGGKRDMDREVLKYGSMIVDALVDYKQPVFVYVPPRCELRGGAWVVVDPRINPLHMEMYADPESRGGVLESNATVGVKYKDPALKATMRRLDPAYEELTKLESEHREKIVYHSNSGYTNASQNKEKRFRELRPGYEKVASAFCDLHDRVERMEYHGVIDGVVAWADAREFFISRLRRQLIMMELRKEVEEILIRRVQMKKPIPNFDDPAINTKTVDIFESPSVIRLAGKIVEEWLSNNNFSDKNFINPGWQAQAMDWELYIQKLSATVQIEDSGPPFLLIGGPLDSSTFGLSHSAQVSPYSTDIENRSKMQCIEPEKLQFNVITTTTTTTDGKTCDSKGTTTTTGDEDIIIGGI